MSLRDFLDKDRNLCYYNTGIYYTERTFEMQGKPRLIKTETIIDKHTGERLIQKDEFIVSAEPSYIKLYLDCLATFKGLRRGVSPFLMELLGYMTYADSSSPKGGQIITITKWHRQQIAGKLGISDSLITKNLTQLVQAGVLKRLAQSVYQANPSMFGKGDWRDIHSLRATFDFVTGHVELCEDAAVNGGETDKERMCTDGENDDRNRDDTAN